MKAIRPPSRRLAAFALIGASVACLAAQTEESMSSAEKQAERNKIVAARGKRIAYTKKYDLSGLPSYKPEMKVTGLLRSWGANYFTDAPLALNWEHEFQKYHPEAKFYWHLKTSLHAIPALNFKASDFGPLGRQITWDELLGFQREYGYMPTAIRVVTGSLDVPGWNPALAVYVHKDNPLAKLSLQQLDGIFFSERSGAFKELNWDESMARGADKNIRTWGQLGLTGEWKDKPIHVHGYNLLFHFPQSMAMRSFGGISNKWNEKLVEYDNKLQPDGSFKIAGQQVLESVAADKFAIGYVAGGPDFAPPGVRPLALSWKDGGPYVDMTLDNIQSHAYPLYEDVFMIVNREPKKPMDPRVREFMRYVLSREGQTQVMMDGKYLPLTAEVVKEELKKLE